MTRYENCCRLCLKVLLGPGINCNNITEIRDTILDLFSVRISPSDTSKCICTECFEKVMSYKAFKKAVLETQNTLQDYEKIKSKILSSIPSTIKQEIIDLVETDGRRIIQKPKKKRRIENPITDSQINEILDTVHDNSGSAPRNDVASTPNRQQIPTTRDKSPQIIDSSVDVIKKEIQETSDDNHTSAASSGHVPHKNQQSTQVSSSTSLVQIPSNYLTNKKNSSSLNKVVLSRSSLGNSTIINHVQNSGVSKISILERCTSLRTSSPRQAKTQAMEKMCYQSPTRTRTVSKSAKTSKDCSINKETNGIDEPLSVRMENVAVNNSNETWPQKINQSPQSRNLNKSSDKKRIITITLLKSKNAVNFNYCDQYKNLIDFDSLTVEEQHDIQASLLVPEIWSNLMNVFKTSPPDENTLSQLRCIFGGSFNLSESINFS